MAEESKPDIPLFKLTIAARSTAIWEALEKAGISPLEIETYSAMGLIFAIGAKAAGASEEAFMGMSLDAYRNAGVYEKDLEGGGNGAEGV